MTLAADEFIRRFLMHVLPRGFMRIRYYGFLANRHRVQKLAIIRGMLGAVRTDAAAQSPPEAEALPRANLSGRFVRSVPLVKSAGLVS